MGVPPAFLRGRAGLLALTFLVAACAREPAPIVAPTRPPDPVAPVTSPGDCKDGCDPGSACTLGVCRRLSTLSAGSEHACAVTGAGKVRCWGRLDPYGGDTRRLPFEVPGLAEVAAVRGTCAVGSSGRIDCWHASEGWTSHAVTGIDDAVDVAVSSSAVCALRRSGTVACAVPPWDVPGSDAPPVSPVAVAGISDAVGIASAPNHTCALSSSGAVVCFASKAPPEVQTAAPVEGVSGAVHIGASSNDICVALRDGRVACWSDGLSGNPMGEPSFVEGVGDAVEVAPGMNHKCALRRDGSVQCWGNPLNGALGRRCDSSSCADGPPWTPIEGLADAIHVTSGDSFSCAVRRAGGVVCWGYARNGRLGNGAGPEVPLASEVHGLHDVKSVLAGAGFSCAVGKGGEVWCWGQGLWGRQDDAPPRRSPVLEKMSSLRPTDDSGQNESGCCDRGVCALRPDGKTDLVLIEDFFKPDLGVYGPLGVPPGKIAGGSLLGGGYAVLRSGQAILWRLPKAGDFAQKATVAPVPGVGDAVQAAGGLGAACFVRRRGGVACARLPPAPEKLTRTDLRDVRDATAIASFEGQYVAVRRSGLILWRADENGVTEPSEVAKSDGIVSAAIGRWFACVVLKTGDVACAGGNQDGQLGNGTLDASEPFGPSSSWTRVEGVSGAIQVAAGTDHACALQGDGRVLCWGDDEHQQVGHVALVGATKPVEVVGLEP